MGLTTKKTQEKHYVEVFGREGHRTSSQAFVYKELVEDQMDKLSLEEKLNPRTARDTAITIYRILKHE